MKFRIIKDGFEFRVQKKYKIGWVNYFFDWSLLPLIPFPLFKYFSTAEIAEAEIEKEIGIIKATKESGTVVKEIEI